MTSALLGLLLPAAAVWIALTALRLREPADSRALTAAVAFGGGIGLSSLSTFWLMAHWGLTGTLFVAADACLWTALGAAGWWHMRHTRAERPSRSDTEPTANPPAALTTADWLARVAFGLVAAVAVATIVTEYMASPHGQWDAWAIWNQKARFLFRGGDQWTASLAIAWSIPSHPMLVATSVARLWSYAGAELTGVPAMLGFTFGVAIVAAVVGALAPSRTRAWIAGTVLVAPGIFAQQVAAQTADLPTAFFVVAALIMLRPERRAPELEAGDAHATLLLGGMLAGFAAWTKNEGLVLVGITTLVVAWRSARHGPIRPLMWWAAGAAPALVAIAWLKLAVAPDPPGYFSEADTVATMALRMFSAERHAVVASLAAQHWIHWGGPRAMGALPLMMAAAAITAFTRSGLAARCATAAIGTMLAGYYATWVLSPIDSVWLIGTSFDRVLIQLWPSMVLVVSRPAAGTPDRAERDRRHVALPRGRKDNSYTR